MAIALSLVFGLRNGESVSGDGAEDFLMTNISGKSLDCATFNRSESVFFPPTYRRHPGNTWEGRSCW